MVLARCGRVKEKPREFNCRWYTVVVGVNLLIGTDGGMMLLDRSGQGKGSKICLTLD